MSIVVCVVPMGDVDDVLSSLSGLFHNISFRVAPHRPLPEEGYSPERRQYRGKVFLDVLRTEKERALGLTDVDLYEEGLNFIFGLAEINGRVCIVSTARLRHPNMKIYHERVQKEVIHELGHTFGLSHCKNPWCVMRFSNTLSDVDSKGVSFCAVCLDAWNNAVRRESLLSKP